MEKLKPNQSSSTFQFYSLHNNNPNFTIGNPLELVESDVVWSSDYSSESVEQPASPTLSTTSNSPGYSRHERHPFTPAKYGLSAALLDDVSPLLQRKPSLNASLSAVSAATAALTIRAVPTNHRSSPSFDEMSGSGSGKFMQSAPVNIPVWPKWKENESFGSGKFDFADDDDDENNGLGEKMFLPPHEIVARSQTMAFSVFEGAGRTLKGRDLRRVRNAVFQKTGFID